MTYPPQPDGYPQQPAYYGPTIKEPAPRPQVVTIAAMLIVLTVLTNVGFGLVIGFGMVAPENVTGDTVDPAGAITIGVASIVVGLAFIAAALGILRGRQGGRIAVFILYGLSTCCGGLLTAGAIAVASDPQESSGAGSTVFAVLTIVALIVYVLVIILLALPPSNRWFRENTFARRAGIIR